MAMPVFDQFNNLHHVDAKEVSSVYKEGNTRRIIALVGVREYYLPYTIEHLDILLSPLEFYQINKNQIINTTRIDKYKFGVITIDDKEYHLSRRRITEFEDFYFPD